MIADRGNRRIVSPEHQKKSDKSEIQHGQQIRNSGHRTNRPSRENDSTLSRKRFDPLAKTPPSANTGYRRIRYGVSPSTPIIPPRHPPTQTASCTILPRTRRPSISLVIPFPVRNEMYNTQLAGATREPDCRSPFSYIGQDCMDFLKKPEEIFRKRHTSLPLLLTRRSTTLPCFERTPDSTPVHRRAPPCP